MAYNDLREPGGRGQGTFPPEWRAGDGQNQHHSSRTPSRTPSRDSVTDDDTDSTTHSDAPSSLPQTPQFMPYFVSKRHITCGNPAPPTPSTYNPPPSWRLNGQKLKTSQAALILCLNIGCDPPDVVKPVPGAVLECWIDPHSMPPSKALEAIGKNLQHKFELLNPRGRVKAYLDPSDQDFRGYMTSLRSRTRDERALVYYNGHGVPKPTTNGEFWVFNRNYTQYIPVSLNDFQDWILAPSIFVWDCSAAGNILHNYIKFAQPKDDEMRAQHPKGLPPDYSPLMDCIHLIACGADETLPMAPELPADAFTSCLTSPIEMALRFFVTQNRPSAPLITLEMVAHIPGDSKDRRTPLGELHWIFTAVTDTIAWSVFPHDVFRRLFRQDLMTAALFRNFLLAERIMRNYNCTPQSYPSLPPTHTHPMWEAWDLAVDACLAQLPSLLRNVPGIHEILPQAHIPPPSPIPYEYEPSSFFTESLTAFNVWLSRGGSALTKRKQQPALGQSNTSPPDDFVTRRPPDQLPILLQVLLSQAHRLRALILLSQFVDLGPWAVHLALEIGIFPYVQRLLQSPAPDVKPVLIFIWARIMAVDNSCQIDLLRENGYMYFVSILAPQNAATLSIPNASEHRAMCAFILSLICRDHPVGQSACFSAGVFDSCVDRLDDEDFLLRQWSSLCIAQLWDGKDDVKAYAIENGTHDRLLEMLNDTSAEVRAAAMYALGTFLGASGSAKAERRGGGGTGGMLPYYERDQFRIEVAVGTRSMLAGKEDASPLVRKELLVLLSALMVEWRGWFVVAAWIYWEKSMDTSSPRARHPPTEFDTIQLESPDADHVDMAIRQWIETLSNTDPRAPHTDHAVLRSENYTLISSFFTIFTVLFELTEDPYPEVATMATVMVDWVMALLVESHFARLPTSTLQMYPGYPPDPNEVTSWNGRSSPQPRSRVPSLAMTPRSPVIPEAPQAPVKRGTLQRTDSMLSTSTVTNTLKRTSSIAASLKNIATGQAFTSATKDDHSSPSPSVHNTPPSPRGIESHFPLTPLVPSPHLNNVEYHSPWSSKAALHPLPTLEFPSPPPAPKSSHYHGFAPSWGSSVALPSYGQSVVFPDKENRSSRQVSRKTDSFTPVDVMTALVKEDLLRQQHRTTQYTQDEYGAPVAPGVANAQAKPFDSGVPLGLGRMESVDSTLPFKSTFFDSSMEYYYEPQMRQADLEEPGSEMYNEQMFKRQQSERMLVDTATQARFADSGAWDRPIASLTNDMVVSQLALHPTEPHLLAADDSNIVTVWDWQKRRRLAVFSNNNPTGTSINTIRFINEESRSMILTGSGDGMVRLYRNYDLHDANPIELVTGFRAIYNIVKMKRGSGLVVDWQQNYGLFLAAGDAKSIRVWDAHRELCIQDIQTRAGSSVTSIASDLESGHTFVVGHADGSLFVHDRRIHGRGSGIGSIVRACQGHRAWIANVHWQVRGAREVISADADGSVCIWDVRMGERFDEDGGGARRGSHALTKTRTKGVQEKVLGGNCEVEMFPQARGLAHMAVHNHANVIATSSAITSSQWRQQTISVDAIPYHEYPTDSAGSTMLSRVVHQTGLHTPPKANRLVPSALAFHPHEMILASGGVDGIVRMYGAKLDNRAGPHLSFELPPPTTLSTLLA